MITWIFALAIPVLLIYIMHVNGKVERLHDKVRQLEIRTAGKVPTGTFKVRRHG